MPKRVLSLHRWSRTLGYAAIAAAGLMYFIFEPSPAIAFALGPVGAKVWAVFMCIGGGVSALAPSKHLAFEYVGLPLIITAWGLFGASLLTLAIDPNLGPDNTRFILGIAFLGIACGFIARWRDVIGLLRLRKQENAAVRGLRGEHD